MMRRKSQRTDNYNLALLDMLFAMCLAYAMLFMISLLMIKPAAKPTETNVKMPAQFLVTMDWPGGALDDIDLWLQLPDGTKVYYQNQSAGYAQLDRDDIGGEHDIIAVSPTNPTFQWLKLNREMITVRGIQPGRYVVAVHVFAVKSLTNGMSTEKPLPYDAHIEVTKLNPNASIVARADVRVEKTNDRITAFAFNVDGEGNVTSVEMAPDDQIITLRSMSDHGS
jgi:hypothetical protein